MNETLTEFKSYSQAVHFLESLQIMPKTMPGIEKLKKALSEKTWFSEIQPHKVIVVAGTNGKGTTCAVLESLLLAAGKNVGLFTSPHLISTSERIRINQVDISEEHFLKLLNSQLKLIHSYELTHFEALTLMAGEYFFGENNLDYIIFEVGLGGLFDATNVFPHNYSVITKLGLDHQNILGATLLEIAQNKWGIIQNNSEVIHHALPQELKLSFSEILHHKQAQAFLADEAQSVFENNKWFMQLENNFIEINLPGERSVENAMTAIKVFERLGYDFSQYTFALKQIKWSGRMQKITWLTSKKNYELYLSGDHNEQGIQSLIEIIKHYDYEKLHLIVGIGKDKNYNEILKKLNTLERVQFYLTETPFKGCSLFEYPVEFLEKAVLKNNQVVSILNQLDPCKNDLTIVTGSLYLVGAVLREVRSYK